MSKRFCGIIVLFLAIIAIFGCGQTPNPVQVDVDVPPQIVEKKVEVPVVKEVIKTVEVEKIVEVEVPGNCPEPEVKPSELPELTLAEGGQSYVLIVRRNMNFKISGRLEKSGPKSFWYTPATLTVSAGDVFLTYGVNMPQQEIQLLPGPQPEYPPDVYEFVWVPGMWGEKGIFLWIKDDYSRFQISSILWE